MCECMRSGWLWRRKKCRVIVVHPPDPNFLVKEIKDGEKEKKEFTIVSAEINC